MMIVLPREMMIIFEKHGTHGNILTKNENSSFLKYFHSFCWPSNENETEKHLLSITCCTEGITSILTVPKGLSYNSTFFSESVMACLQRNICARGPQKTLKYVSITLTNAPGSNSRPLNKVLEGTKVRNISHLPLSLDRLPCDFFFFGYLTKQLSDRSRNSPNDIICRVIDDFDFLYQDQLSVVYDE
jgi:hypothetical protein